jgi:hypothetical protein
MYQYQTWQANDPLVHYLETDLRGSNPTNQIYGVVPPSGDVDALSNVRKVNDRYQPWGGNPNQSEDPNGYNLALKDPLVRRSDDWNFPTNKFPNIGWLGRVHRGTPWQTMYLKSEDIDDKTWKEWSGNSSQDIEGNDDATRTKPYNDHNLLDLFTVALNDNATRGQLSVNQTNLASWSAVLSGVLALTNNVSNADLSSSRLFSRVETAPVIIEPVGINGTNAPLWTIYEGINRTRANTNLFPNGVFRRMGHVLRTPELSVRSPYLNTNSVQLTKGISDELYERIPQMILSLLKTGDSRFVVYSYGQSLKPADRSIVQSGPFFGMCTNYQITGEMVTRSVVRIDGSLNDPNNPPRAVIESFNVLPPE